MARLTLKIILMACIGSLLVGCSTVISHSKSGKEENIYAKRSLGTAIDDNSIVGRIESKLRQEDEQFASMIQVDAYNRIVLLTGRVPDQNFIDKAVEIASETPGVRQVHLEITQGDTTTISNYWYDAWLTTKVKSQLALTSNAPSAKTKVRSFAGYVYLMGVMTEQEAKNAIYVTSRIPGAKKVISLIETLDDTGKAIVANPPSESKSAGAPASSSYQQPPANDYGYTEPQEVDDMPMDMNIDGSGNPQEYNINNQYPSENGNSGNNSRSNNSSSGFYVEEPAAESNQNADPDNRNIDPGAIDPGYETRPVDEDNYDFQNDYQTNDSYQSVEPRSVKKY